MEHRYQSVVGYHNITVLLCKVVNLVAPIFTTEKFITFQVSYIQFAKETGSQELTVTVQVLPNMTVSF